MNFKEFSEFDNPTAETIKKVKAKLESKSKHI